MSSTADKTTSPDTNLANRASRGASITFFWQLIRIATQLLTTVILARLLLPEDFGLVAMVTAIVGLGEVLRDFGLTTAAVQAKTLSRGQKSNLFWLNFGIGIVLTGVVFACAPLIGAVYGEPRLVEITQILAFTFLLNGFSTQFRAELTREMRFLAANVTETVPPIIGLAVAAVIAAVTHSFWAIVAQKLVVTVIVLILAVCVARWWPGLPSRKEPMRRLLAIGGGVAGTQSVDYVTKNIDNVLIGYVWGASPLGLYSRAYQLLMVPIVQMLAPMTRVAMPVLSRLQDQPDRFLAFLRRGQLLGTVLVGIVYAMAFGLAAPLVTIVFGEAWLQVVPIFQALAVGGVFRAMSQVSYWAYLALGRSGAQFRYYLVSQPFIIGSILIGLPWGPEGVAVALSTSAALNWAVGLLWCGRVTGLPMGSMIVYALRSTALVTVPVAIINLGMTALIPSDFGAVGCGAAATLAFLALSYWLIPPTRRDLSGILDVVKRVRRRRSS